MYMKAYSVALILDDQQLFADLFSYMLKQEHLFDTVKSFHHMDDLRDCIKNFEGAEFYLFLDDCVKSTFGLRLVSVVRKMSKSVKIIILTGTTSPIIAEHIMAMKPNAVISKAIGIRHLSDCKDTLERGGVYLAPNIVELIKRGRGLPRFTSRELEVLSFFEQGMSVAETALETGLSPHTVVTHRRNMMNKTNSRSIGQLIKYSKDNGVL